MTERRATAAAALMLDCSAQHIETERLHAGEMREVVEAEKGYSARTKRDSIVSERADERIGGTRKRLKAG